MVLIVGGVTLDECPLSLHALFQSHPGLKESSVSLCSVKSQVVGPAGLLYVTQREYAVTHPHDNKVSILGTDDVTTNTVLVIKQPGQFYTLQHDNSLVYNCLSYVAANGATLLSNVDRMKQDDLETMLQKVSPSSYGYENRLKVHIIGAFTDNKNVSETVVLSLLGENYN